MHSYALKHKIILTIPCVSLVVVFVVAGFVVVVVDVVVVVVDVVVVVVAGFVVVDDDLVKVIAVVDVDFVCWTGMLHRSVVQQYKCASRL